jgi:hypothetical protein
MSADPPRGLTKEEFEQLLQRAAERHALAGPRDFTVAELVEAGRDLGIDEATVRTEHAEFERRRAEPPARARPFDSDLELEHDGDTLRLVIPPRASMQVAKVVRGLAIGGMVLALGAAVGGEIGAVLGGVVGTLVIHFSVRSARMRRELRLKRDGSGVLARFVGGKGRGLPLQAGQVRARLGQRMVSGQYGGTQVDFLALDHGTETYELLEGHSHAERAWAVEEIERWLGHAPPRGG